jgi:hypothetical protein
MNAMSSNHTSNGESAASTNSWSDAKRRGSNASGLPYPETWLALARHNRYSHSKVARLLQYLVGAGTLDTTVVVATSDMGDPARHSSRNLPTLIVSGAKTGIRTGRYLDVRSNGTGVPNNHLLVSLARRFGADIDSFGDAAPELAAGTIDI